MKESRLTNLLLGLLVLGVWSIFFTSVTQNWLSNSVDAQNKSKQAISQKQYTVAAVDKQGNLTFGGDGGIVLNATGLQTTLKEAPKQGWKIHTVTSYTTEYLFGWVVVLEK